VADTLVSVVIPCYRQAHFLSQAVESVLAQTHTCHEIIVIDDGSPDHVREVVAAYPGVRYHFQENRGLAAARNRGLQETRGEYVVFLDADDRLLPTALAAGVTALSARPECAFVWGFHRPIDARGNLLPSEPRSFSGGAGYAQLLRANVVGSPMDVMFRRSAVVAVGGFSRTVRYVEDYDLYLRLSRNHANYCHGELIAEYRYHDANMSADRPGMLREVLRALDEQASWVGNDSALRQALQEGRRWAWERYDGEPRVQRLREHLRAKRWLPATACTATLLVKYPRMFFQVMARRAKRALSPSSEHL